MERINPPGLPNYIIRSNSEPESCLVHSELGIYGVILGWVSDRSPCFLDGNITRIVNYNFWIEDLVFSIKLKKKKIVWFSNADWVEQLYVQIASLAIILQAFLFLNRFYQPYCSTDKVLGMIYLDIDIESETQRLKWENTRGAFLWCY